MPLYTYKSPLWYPLPGGDLVPRLRKVEWQRCFEVVLGQRVFTVQIEMTYNLKSIQGVVQGMI